MIIVHNEAGLGNQMMDYAEYYIMKKLNPHQDVYLEKVLFDIEECQGTVSMWNGYELNNIFNLDEETDYLENVIGTNTYKEFVEYVRNSKFWEKDWNYPKPIVEFLNKTFYSNFVNCCSGGLGTNKNIWERVYWKIYRKLHPLYDIKQSGYIVDNQDYYCGHSFPLLSEEFDFDYMRKDFLRIFKFPEIDINDIRNYEYMVNIKNSEESCGIHIRRGDLLVYNSQYYANGYFYNAINYIKSHKKNVSFYIFSDQYSRDWAMSNKEVLGLNENDEVIFVEGNDSQNSFRDMQLLSLCKHQIITNSSFGWWASYLNTYDDKITISPQGTFKTTIQL